MPLLLLPPLPTTAQAQDTGAITAEQALELVRQAWDNVRGKSSYAEVTMTIHRPDWERSMSMKAWTKGQDDSLVRVTEPRKDAGNGTLTLDEKMWTFSPKINRVIKVPSSMMNQSWMGSDFSNKDISRNDDIVDQYDHKMLGLEKHGGIDVYVIESIPKEDSAVVWGKEVLKIRKDGVLLSQEYYDQDNELVKAMVSLEVGKLGGRTLAIRQRMGKAGTDDEWTEVKYDALEFGIPVEDTWFTLSNLRNPRQ